MFGFKTIVKNLAIFISSIIIFLSMSHNSLGTTPSTQTPEVKCLELLVSSSTNAETKRYCQGLLLGSSCKDAETKMNESRSDFIEACGYKPSDADTCISFHQECKQEEDAFIDEEDAEDRLSVIKDMADQCPLKLAVQQESFQERSKELKEDLKELEKEVDEAKQEKNELKKECDEKEHKIKEDLANLETKKKEEQAEFDKALEDATQDSRDQYAQLAQQETQLKTQIETNKERILDAERTWLLQKFEAQGNCQNYAAAQYGRKRLQVEQRLTTNTHIVSRQSLMRNVGLSRTQVQRLKSAYDYRQCTRAQQKGVTIPANAAYLQAIRLAELNRTRTITSAEIALRNLHNQLSSMATQKANLSRSLLKNNQNLANRFANQINDNTNKFILLKQQEVQNGTYCSSETNRIAEKLTNAEERSKAKSRNADIQDDIDGFIANRNLPSTEKAEELRKAISTHFGAATVVFASCNCATNEGRQANQTSCNYVCKNPDFAGAAEIDCSSGTQSGWPTTPAPATTAPSPPVTTPPPPPTTPTPSTTTAT